MMLYARSCERPSKSSSSVFFPSSVSNSYSFSTGTQGSSRRFSAALRPSSPCSASSFASSSRAACHSSCVPTLCSAIALPPSSGSRNVDRRGRRNSSVREHPLVILPARREVGLAGDLPEPQAAHERFPGAAGQEEAELGGDGLGPRHPHLEAVVFHGVQDGRADVAGRDDPEQPGPTLARQHPGLHLRRLDEREADAALPVLE